ncbi:TPA: hypothetical protein QDB28_005222 [Burkholderia vietnamiensis]|uniref:hypothetical protein n=1 Tax=Burkholderia vietnamiensis TaxID=60552 RepID=UPI0015898E39|nr:hypothetical protein [Burkholderia vietnamiensis]HDR9164787.1 hypothetical protein [Burkholderia vietnamiensis]
MSFYPATSSDLAAWVQAVGSIVAILCSVKIAVWQADKTQEQTLFTLNQQRLADHLRSAKTLLELARNALKVQVHVAGKLDSREAIYNAAEDRLPFDLPEMYALEVALNKIELHLLPSELVALALIVAATMRQFRIKVDMVLDTHRQMDAAAFDDFFAVMRQMQESMRLTIADLEAKTQV